MKVISDNEQMVDLIYSGNVNEDLEAKKIVIFSVPYYVDVKVI